MSQAMILDTETSGLIEPDVIQLAARGPLEFHVPWAEAPTETRSFKPRKPIEPAAMATHHIIMEDLDGFPEWPGFWSPPLGVQYLIGHQIDFDWKAIGSPNQCPPPGSHALGDPIKRIDTMAIAKHAWPDLGSYRLTALIYHIYKAAEAREMCKNAHVAAVDIYLAETLLDHLLCELIGAGKVIQSWEDLWKISEESRIPLRIGFSKYGPKEGRPGTLYSEVPLGMLRWIVDPIRVKDMDQWEVKAAQKQIALRG